MEQKPWLKHYDPGVPSSLVPYPEVTFLDIVAETVRQRPDHPAVFFKGARLSYAEIQRLSNSLAAALAALGVKKQDRVALLLPNCPQMIIGHFGAWKAGGLVVPVNPFYTSDELARLLNDCGAEIAIVLTPFYRKLKEIQPRTKLRAIIATNIKEYLPPITRLLFSLAKEKKGGHVINLEPGDVRLQDLLRQYARSSPPDVAVKPGDPAVLLFSGGTTGTPKGALGSHHALVMAGMQLRAWFGAVVKEWDATVMQVLPLFHVYGNAGVMASSLIGHNPLALVPDPRDIKDVISAMRKLRPALLPCVPTFFTMLLKHPYVTAGKADFSYTLGISGAAPISPETVKKFKELTGSRIIEGYGLTESMMAAIINPVKGVNKPGSIGMPLPDVEVRIADADTGEGSLPAGKNGEIMMKAPNLMLEYYHRPEETANVIRGGWLTTGDIGYLDEDGYVFIVGRKKDLIKAGGFQIWPQEVEDVIAAMPGIADVSVAGVPDPYRGETVKAWVVLQPGQSVTEEAIKAWCREKLSSYKVPALIEFRAILPKSLIGKALHRQLVEEHKEKQAVRK